MPQRTVERSSYETGRTAPFGTSELPLPVTEAFPSGGNTDKDKNGVIIVHNNQICITPPLPAGRPAVISAIHPVILKLKGQTVTAPTEITSADDLTWEIVEKPLYQITVSDDRTRAYFTLYRVEQYAWRLTDCGAANEVTVRAEPDRSALLSTLTVNQVVAALKDSPLLSHLNIPALYSELNQPTYKPICIAEGKPPLQGRNGRLEQLFSEEIIRAFRCSRAEGGFPHSPPVARLGEIIARKLPPADGVPGFDVYGRLLPAPPSHDFKLRYKDQAALLPGGELLALRQGRPRFLGGGDEIAVDFPRSYVIPEDMGEGAIMMFAGDVVFTGDTPEHTTIDAFGNVYIYGDVRSSAIAATGSIFVLGKVTDSQLHSGCYGVTYNRLSFCSALLIQEISRLREACAELARNVESRQQTVQYGFVVMLQLESKYAHLPRRLHELLGILAGMDATFPRNTAPLKSMLEIFLHPGQFSRHITDDLLLSFLKQLQDVYDSVAKLEENQVIIDIAEARGSTLLSGGDLVIHGAGVCSSKLAACGHIRFRQNEAVCTGSIAEAGGQIEAQTVGGKDARGSVLVAGERISVRRIHRSGVAVGEYGAAIDHLDEATLFTVHNMKDYM
ncbi:flagellar assembly protein A [Paenibacillus tepidiphilus]|uniref:flagellar assembly protein A n=1 Tax=Paenibacillus tepidiphilus TaxID=2608683 RepID=UPI0013A5464C|nr:flagellar assembly protein A [Paenibacillus tepidiphilus]